MRAEQLLAFLQTATTSLLANTSGERERDGKTTGVAVIGKSDRPVPQGKD